MDEYIPMTSIYQYTGILIYSSQLIYLSQRYAAQSTHTAT